MPRCDRTGPRGEGPRTGRGSGHCSGSSVPEHRDRGARGCGCGHAHGGGRGRGHSHRQEQAGRPSDGPVEPLPGKEQTAGDEKAYLEDMVKSLETELEELRARLASLPG